MVLNPFGRLISYLSTLPLLCLLSACNGSGTYASGPWGQSHYLDPSVSLYPRPWNKPLDASLVEPHSVPPSPRRTPSDPMEPIGAWASRSIAPPDVDLVPDNEMEVSSSLSPLIAEKDNRGTVSTDYLPSQGAAISQPQSPAKSLNSLTGHWAAQEGAGSCRIQLSSVPTLDLYKASASRCSNVNLQNINSWIYRDGDIILYSRGHVVSRLKEDGAAFKGTLDGAGGPLRISR
jgi:hypothetical protein